MKFRHDCICRRQLNLSYWKVSETVYNASLEAVSGLIFFLSFFQSEKFLSVLHVINRPQGGQTFFLVKPEAQCRPVKKVCTNNGPGGCATRRVTGQSSQYLSRNRFGATKADLVFRCSARHCPLRRTGESLQIVWSGEKCSNRVIYFDIENWSWDRTVRLATIWIILCNEIVRLLTPIVKSTCLFNDWFDRNFATHYVARKNRNFFISYFLSFLFFVVFQGRF